MVIEPKHHFHPRRQTGTILLVYIVLAFVSLRHSVNFEKSISGLLPRYQHRPVVMEVKPALRPIESKPTPKFNFRRANWHNCVADLDARVMGTSKHLFGTLQKRAFPWEVRVQISIKMKILTRLTLSPKIPSNSAKFFNFQ